MSIGWVEANGVSLRYDLRRKGSGRRLLVLLHEAMGLMESWDETLQYFDAAFDVLRYDQRGFGLSQKTDQLTMDTAVDDLASLLDELGITEPIFLSGCGFGGALSLSFAVKHPRRVAGIFAASPSGTRSPDSEMGRQLLVRADNVEKLGLASMVPGFFDLSYPTVLRENHERFQKFRLRWLGNAPKQVANILRAASKLHLVPTLPTIQTPTTIVGCKHDLRAPPAEMKELAGKMPNGRFVEINSGHFAAVQTPDVFAAAAIEHLSAIPGA